MDFSDFITLILFFVFIFAPLFKRRKKVKVQKTGKSKPSGFDILGKIRDALEEAAKQAEQNRKTETSGQRMHAPGDHESPFDRPVEDDHDQAYWDEMDDREDVDFYPDNADAQVLEPIEPAKEEPIFVSTRKGPHSKAANRQETRRSKSFGQGAVQRRCHRSGQRRLPAQARGLRKAVMWSEILGKPAALRDSDSFCRY
ncbi:hypothetical protein [uncultured Desulfobacter sp.]|uniref:hypothetical protein n=1 Tax=uncultured Desulfobacter sp. TaxID=240139 RepID=UPI0029F49B08|nr:hypothetical protein [uncultured Desulfobacter sp.]